MASTPTAMHSVRDFFFLHKTPPLASDFWDIAAALSQKERIPLARRLD